MRRSCKSLVKTLILSIGVIGFNWLILTHNYSKINPENEPEPRVWMYLKKFLYNDTDLVDYHDNIAYEQALAQTGPGEQGRPVILTNREDIEAAERAKVVYGYNAVVSDQIALNRSLPDIRHEKCKTIKYLRALPSVSIIIPFNNEAWSVLVRSCHGILNRSPSELIKEIIFVNDASTVEDTVMFGEYAAEHFPKVRFLHLQERKGLIAARLAAARIAKADILIFLDAHVEPGYNWLPPLIEPIVKNSTICVTPLIDVIHHDTFEHGKMDDGGRGLFDWGFGFWRLPLPEEDSANLPEPYKSPIMMGGLFAIGRDFFWTLGGYDEGLYIWGGEQYEISFKIWMCGGQILEVPCSRVAHVAPSATRERLSVSNYEYILKNYKRVAEVWMDEYKEYIYMRTKSYKDINAGDLTKQKVLRENLKCRSFKWFMDEVAFDLSEYFPPSYPPEYAWGTIESVALPGLCLDTFGQFQAPIGIFPCAEDSEWPQQTQRWSLSSYRDLRLRYEEYCADSFGTDADAPVVLEPCHKHGGNQLWNYDLDKKLLIQPLRGKCLEANAANNTVFTNICDPNNIRMQWTFGVINGSAFQQVPLQTLT